MKKLFAIFFLSLIVILSTIKLSNSAYYTVTKLTDDSYFDYAPQINDSGLVVWGKGNGTNIDVLLYDGTSITNISNNSFLMNRNYQINASGQVVWQANTGGNNDIFFYNGTSTTRLTNNYDVDEYPQINDSGLVVWDGNIDGPGTDYEILLYDSTGITNISDNFSSDVFPQINNNGQIVWVNGWSIALDMEIYLYDGGIINISNNSYGDRNPQINNSGLVVWEGCDGTDCSSGIDDYEIYLYDGTSTTQLTDNSYDDLAPQINDSGQVVWKRADGPGTDYEIYLYDGTSTIQLTNNSIHDGSPQINDSGLVVWPADYEIYLYDGTDITNISNLGLDDRSPQINNSGQIVWSGDNGMLSDSEIYLATPTSCLDPVRITGIIPVYFDSLQNAYDIAVNGDTIQSQDTLFNGDLNIDINKTVTFEGGYDCGYTTVIGKTTLNGTLTISNGTLTIGNFILE